MDAFSPEACHAPLLAAAPKRLAFDPSRDFAEWRGALDAKLRELLGHVPAKVPPNVRITSEQAHDAFVEKRFTFTAEANADVPCHLLIPMSGKAPFPVMICLQGHTSGMHISLGRAKSKKDEETIQEGDRDFAIRAVQEGYAALVLEQRCFGERADRRPKEIGTLKISCHHPSLSALLLGRTMVGERVWDVSRAIDALAESFPEVDSNRVACMGNSGGGTTTYFAACVEPRIRAAMPSCYVCTFEDSIGTIDHCMCNYIPGILDYFEMGDLAGLIAPRPLIVVAGREDTIFPFHAVQKTFRTIQQVYAAAGAPERCRLVVGEGGHRFYADAAWAVFHDVVQWQPD